MISTRMTRIELLDQSKKHHLDRAGVRFVGHCKVGGNQESIPRAAIDTIDGLVQPSHAWVAVKELKSRKLRKHKEIT